MEQLVFSNNDFPDLMGDPQGMPTQGYDSAPSMDASSTSLGSSEPSTKGDDERAPLSMRPKRVGRKLDTKEPESKRRAQNRAAQRAFRERKERHLHELETRIQELEQESATWRNSSIQLRSKVSILEQELSERRSSNGGPTPASSGSPQIPQQQPQQQPRQQQPLMQQIPQIPLSQPKPTPVPPPAQQSAPTPLSTPGTQAALAAAPAAPQQLPSPNNSSTTSQKSTPLQQRTPSIDNLFYDSYGGTPSSTTSAVTPAQAAMGENPTPSEFCEELNLACVVPPSQDTFPNSALKSTRYIGVPASLLNDKGSYTSAPTPVQISSNQDLIPNFLDLGDIQNLSNETTPVQAPVQQVAPHQVQTPQQTSQQAPVQVPGQSQQVPAPAAPAAVPAQSSLLNFSFQDDQQFDLASFVNNDSTLFDGFDLDAVWNNDSMPSLPTQSGDQQGFLQPKPDVKLETAKPEAKANGQQKGVAEIVPATNEKYISCTEVWDRICSRPRFGEIDIQGMCVELRAKAKCSDSGVVLPERDVESLLNSYQ